MAIYFSKKYRSLKVKGYKTERSLEGKHRSEYCEFEGHHYHTDDPEMEKHLDAIIAKKGAFFEKVNNPQAVEIDNGIASGFRGTKTVGHPRTVGKLG